MAAITPPKYVRQVLFTLQGRGYPAYLVGGCVRDLLLERRPHDWDICTAALPEQVLALFPDSQPGGRRPGAVTVAIGSRRVEVTSFHTDAEEGEHRCEYTGPTGIQCRNMARPGSRFCGIHEKLAQYADSTVSDDPDSLI